VRAAFEAKWECARAHGNAACSPITPATLSFTSPVDRAAALGARLVFPDGTTRAPHVDEDEKARAKWARSRLMAPSPRSRMPIWCCLRGA
jgi:hypothetical protein